VIFVEENGEGPGVRLRKMSDIAKVRDRDARVRKMIEMRRKGAPDAVLRELNENERRQRPGYEMTRSKASRIYLDGSVCAREFSFTAGWPSPKTSPTFLILRDKRPSRLGPVHKLTAGTDRRKSEE